MSPVKGIGMWTVVVRVRVVLKLPGVASVVLSGPAELRSIVICYEAWTI